MNKYFMRNKELINETRIVDFDHSFDVVVLGLGTAGALALISAARQGLRVLGIEPMTCMGGIGTAGGIHNYCVGSKGGIQVEVDERCAEIKDTYYTDGVRSFHPEAKKYVLEQMADEAGAEYWYNSVVHAAYAEDKRALGVEVLSPNGVVQVQARYIIDASGDAHTAAMLGCPSRFGRDIDAYPQPYSFIRGSIGQNNMFNHDNFDAGYVDPRDPEDMSKATIHSTSLHCWDSYTEEKNITFLSPQFGLREGRFIIGEETVSFEDVVHERNRDNMIMQSWSFHDNHCSDWAFESPLSQEYAVIADRFRRAQVADIPPGIFIPQNWDGILIAGRCVSLDHDSHQGIRMQSDMQKFGEITGIMAALAIKHNCRSVDIPFEELRGLLLESGCLPPVEKRKKRMPWLTDEAKIKRVLSSDDPGEAIWSARLLGKSIHKQLHQWMNSDDEILSRHSMWALGLQHDASVIPALIKDVEQRGTELPLEHSHDRGRLKYASVCLLGILADERAEQCLIKLLQQVCNDATTATHLLVALLRIADKHEQRRQRILDALTSYFQAHSQQLLTMWNNPDNPIDLNDFSLIHIKQCAQRWGLDFDLQLEPQQRREQEMLARLAG